MIELRINDQDGQLVCHRRPQQCLGHNQQVTVLQLDSMLTLRGEPAASKALRGHRNFTALPGGPVKALRHRFFGHAPDNCGRNQDHDGQDKQYGNNTFFHVLFSSSGTRRIRC